MSLNSDRTQLEAALQEAQAEQAELEKRLAEKPELGPGTGSSGAQEWEMTLARKEEVATQIKALEDSLAKVQTGTYGRCERCGNEINPERLEILPTTTLCAQCAGASPTSEASDQAQPIVPHQQ